MIGPSAQPVSFRRRQLLQAGCIASLSWLAGCARSNGSPVLRAPTKSLPALWQKQLKSPWRITELKAINGSAPPWLSSTDLLTIGDGWLSSLNPRSFQAIDAAPVQAQLGPSADQFLSELPTAWKGKILPVGVSPWVMLFRGEPALQKQAANSWKVLLDPDFKGKVLLPSSPRLVMSLAAHMQTPDALQRLRQAAISFDDRHALNWLLQGDAQVAVLPLQRCMGALLRRPKAACSAPCAGGASELDFDAAAKFKQRALASRLGQKSLEGTTVESAPVSRMGPPLGSFTTQHRNVASAKTASCPGPSLQRDLAALLESCPSGSIGAGRSESQMGGFSSITVGGGTQPKADGSPPTDQESPVDGDIGEGNPHRSYSLRH